MEHAPFTDGLLLKTVMFHSYASLLGGRLVVYPSGTCNQTWLVGKYYKNSMAKLPINQILQQTMFEYWRACKSSGIITWIDKVGNPKNGWWFLKMKNNTVIPALNFDPRISWDGNDLWQSSFFSSMGNPGVMGNYQISWDGILDAGCNNQLHWKWTCFHGIPWPVYVWAPHTWSSWLRSRLTMVLVAIDL